MPPRSLQALSASHQANGVIKNSYVALLYSIKSARVAAGADSGQLQPVSKAHNAFRQYTESSSKHASKLVYTSADKSHLSTKHRSNIWVCDLETDVPRTTARQLQHLTRVAA